MQCPGEEQDLSRTAFGFSSPDHGRNSLQIILLCSISLCILQYYLVCSVEQTETTPMTPYPPSSAAFSILTALLFSIGFAMLM
jgi:hypothetical protein